MFGKEGVCRHGLGDGFGTGAVEEIDYHRKERKKKHLNLRWEGKRKQIMTENLSMALIP